MRKCESEGRRGQLFSIRWGVRNKGKFSSSDDGEIQHEGRVASDGGHAEEARVRASFIENVNVEFPR